MFASTDIFINLHARIIQGLLSSKDDGRLKFFTILRALSARRDHAKLFEHGEYIPLEVSGKYKSHIVAFARRHESEWAVIAVPLHLVALISTEQLPLGGTVWQDTSINLPENAPREWLNVITEKSLESTRSLDVGSTLAEYPVAMLLSA